jgi:antitoxin component YwqK of YwqJK toxin-antitoxin module
MTFSSRAYPLLPHEASQPEASKHQLPEHQTANIEHRASTIEHRFPNVKTLCLGLLLLGAVACQPNKENAFAGKNGVQVAYYRDSKTVQSRFETKDGQKHGLFQSYYPSGRVKSEARYENGLRVGQVTHFHEDGRVQSVDHYELMGGDRSVRTTYFDSTQVVKIRVHLKNGVAEGLTQQYYPNGKLKSETTYHDGYRQGPAKLYYEDGKIRSLSFFKGDRQDSVSRTYYPTGQLNVESTYYAGRLHGPYKRYTAAGKLEKQLTYQNGAPLK